MRKLKVVLFMVVMTAILQNVFAQEFELTPNNFVDKGDHEKNYIVIDVPETPKEELFKRAKKYVNTVFNNPKFVTSETIDEQIVVDGRASKPVVIMYNWAGKNQWNLEYKIEFQFKDNKIKFTPIFKKFENMEGEEISLVGPKILGMNSAVFNEKGNVNKKKGNEYAESYINNFYKDFKDAILVGKSSDDEW